MKIPKKSETGKQRVNEKRRKDAMPILLPVVVFFIIIGVLAVLSYKRNSIYLNHVTLWEDITKRSPQKRRAHENYGQALSTAAAAAEDPVERKQLLDKALREFQMVTALPDDGSVPLRDLYRELGVVYFRLEKYDAAAAAWEKGLQDAPSDPSLLNNLSVVMMQTRRYDEAAKHAKAALVASPFMPQALNTMAQVYMIKKNHAKAVEYFMQALEQQPDMPQRYWNVALALESAGKFEEAHQYANRYVAMESDSSARRRAIEYLEHLKKRMKQR